MLRNIKALRGYSIRARDGDIGKVHEFYFDDGSWTIRYLVVNTGSWLAGRRVLLSPVALGPPDQEARVVPVDLTREQVEHSPDIDADRPVSRQQEGRLHQYYGWTGYWTLSPMGTAFFNPQQTMALAESGEEGAETEGDPHLRSTREVIGYHIQARDGEIGHVADFIAEDESWIIRYMVVDTRNWLPGRKVLIAPRWIDSMDWCKARVHVGLDCARIESSPEFDPSEPVARPYEERLHNYYDRPKYWS